MITPLSPLVKRKSFPQKVTQIAVKLWKKCLKTFINALINIKCLFISIVKSVINRKYF